MTMNFFSFHTIGSCFMHRTMCMLGWCINGIKFKWFISFVSYIMPFTGWYKNCIIIIYIFSKSRLSLLSPI